MSSNVDDTSVVTRIADRMVGLPGGTISLRDDRTQEVWTVELAPFLIDRFPMTQRLYRAVMNESPSTFEGDHRPVESVTWREAASFCNALSLAARLTPCYAIGQIDEEITIDPAADGYRLPTEAEWEYACRAGTTGPRYGELDAIAWYRENSERSTHDVGLKEPNAWGLHDMIGNVWEWCSDVYDTRVYGSYRIFRGGGWYDEPRGCLASNRRRSHPTSFAIDDLGFRIARSVGEGHDRSSEESPRSHEA